MLSKDMEGLLCVMTRVWDVEEVLWSGACQWGGTRGSEKVAWAMQQGAGKKIWREQEEGKTAEQSAEAAAGSFLRQVAQPQW